MSRCAGRALLVLMLSAVAAGAAAQGTAKAGAEPELTGVLKRMKDSGALGVGYAEAQIPFSYFDKTKKIVGYSIDVCNKVVDAIKAEIKKPDLKVEMKPVKVDDAASYIASGVIDMHCGPVLNTWARKGQVEFGMTYFVRRYKFASHESAQMNEIGDMNGRILVAYGEAANALQALNDARGFRVTVVPARSNDDAFRIFRSDLAQAVVLDEVSLAEGIQRNQALDPYMIQTSDGAFSAEPYSLVYLKGDPALRKLMVETLRRLYTGGQMSAIYNKWFQSSIPAPGINLHLPMSEPLQKAFANPTDSPDPGLYQ